MRKQFVLLVLYSFINMVHLAAQPVANQYQFRRTDISKGLSHNRVTSLLKDSKGFMWMGTMSGLDRFDGYKFKVFKHDNKDTLSIDDDYVTQILELPEGKLLIETRNWMNIYDPLTEKFSHNLEGYFSKMGLPTDLVIKTIRDTKGDYYFLFNTQGLYKYEVSTQKAMLVYIQSNSSIHSVAKNKEGNLWLTKGDGTIELFDTKAGKVIYRTDLLSNYIHKKGNYYRIFADNDNELWIYTSEDNGAFRINPATNSLTSINKENGKLRLNSNLVMGILQDNQSNIWICTDHGGVNIINKKDNSIQYIVNNPDNINSLSQNSITANYKDDNDIVWIGTYKKGVNSYSPNIIKFPLYRNHPGKPNSLGYDDVNRFAEDAKGNIWIGTNGGGLIYFDRTKDVFTQYKHEPSNSNSLSNDVIVGLCVDSKQRLWIGTYFGGMDCFDGKTFTHYQHNPADSKTIGDNRIWDIRQQTGTDNLWIATLGAGLDKFDIDKKIFYHLSPNIPNSVNSFFI